MEGGRVVRGLLHNLYKASDVNKDIEELHSFLESLLIVHT